MKRAVSVLTVVLLAMGMITMDVCAAKDKGSSVMGTLGLIKNDKGEVTGITITTKSGTVYNVNMTDFTQNVSKRDGQEVVANGEVKDVEGKMIITVKGKIRKPAEKKAK
ncbi:MAG: hypothetical protein PHR77_01170 [Kiritimatiellae bacterium]|nr:hypothetical protein [Kiritimatiellia bacterium]MDD5522564.1 hypothetical protein [Kiritimatiellia bacterium]